MSALGHPRTWTSQHVAISTYRSFPAQSIQHGDEQIAEARLAVGSAGHAEAAGGGERGIVGLEEDLAVKRDAETFVYGPDLERVRLAGSKGVPGGRRSPGARH